MVVGESLNILSMQFNETPAPKPMWTMLYRVAVESTELMSLFTKWTVFIIASANDTKCRPNDTFCLSFNESWISSYEQVQNDLFYWFYWPKIQISQRFQSNS